MIRWVVLVGIVAGCVGYLVYSATGTQAEYYRTVAEVKGNPGGADSRVLGTVQNDVQRLDGGLEVHFTAAQEGVDMPVDFKGQLPEGRMGADGVFHARTLLAKCPSRFTAAPAA